jgi:heme-degrading monooxygenase HmoA
VREEVVALRVARVAIFESGTQVQDDDERRSASLRALLRQVPGFVSGWHLRAPESGRLMSITVWESEEALERGEAAVSTRPVDDQRGIQPAVVERWIVEGTWASTRWSLSA